MAEPYIFERRARRPYGYAMMIIALTFLMALIFGAEAHPFMIAVFAVIISPAIWDMVIDRRATLRLDNMRINWARGSISGDYPLGDIEKVRLGGRFTRFAHVYLRNGDVQFIPRECLPNLDILRAEFKARGISVS